MWQKINDNIWSVVWTIISIGFMIQVFGGMEIAKNVHNFFVTLVTG